MFDIALKFSSQLMQMLVCRLQQVFLFTCMTFIYQTGESWPWMEVLWRWCWTGWWWWRDLRGGGGYQRTGSWNSQGRNWSRREWGWQYSWMWGRGRHGWCFEGGRRGPCDMIVFGLELKGEGWGLHPVSSPEGRGSWAVGAGSCLQCVGGNSGQGSAAGEIWPLAEEGCSADTKVRTSIHENGVGDVVKTAFRLRRVKIEQKLESAASRSLVNLI